MRQSSGAQRLFDHPAYSRINCISHCLMIEIATCITVNMAKDHKHITKLDKEKNESIREKN
jgi:hypothetical protein